VSHFRGLVLSKFLLFFLLLKEIIHSQRYNLFELRKGFLGSQGLLAGMVRLPITQSYFVRSKLRIDIENQRA
jgi:hypothetical protein